MSVPPKPFLSAGVYVTRTLLLSSRAVGPETTTESRWLEMRCRGLTMSQMPWHAVITELTGPTLNLTPGKSHWLIKVSGHA